MNGVNKAILVGHLGADPEIRRSQSGATIASFPLATGESWRDKATGERKERTDWHRVVVFNEALVKVAEQYLKKGAKVYVEGAMRTRKWTDSKGIERYLTEVVLTGFNAPPSRCWMPASASRARRARNPMAATPRRRRRPLMMKFRSEGADHA